MSEQFDGPADFATHLYYRDVEASMDGEDRLGLAIMISQYVDAEWDRIVREHPEWTGSSCYDYEPTIPTPTARKDD